MLIRPLDISLFKILNQTTMKPLRFSGLLFTTVFSLFFTSCGGGSSEKTAATDSTKVDTAVAAVAPPSTIVTTPEYMAIVVHKVASYAKWLPAYESDDSVRLANGIHNYVIGRGMKDTNTVLVALRITDTAKAYAFMKDPRLKAAMKKGGVTSVLSTSVTLAVWQDTATLAPGTLRARTTYTVKDWDVWLKNFEDGKQERMDNGIVARVVGHDATDNHKISLVTAVVDTAKAFAYYKSDKLKARFAAGGATTPPDRWLFTIVKRY
jgi:hypothetical protein